MYQTVEKIIRQNGRAAVWFVDGDKMEFPAALLKLKPIRQGQPVNQSEYLSFVEEKSYPFALEKAVRLQSMREHSVAEIRRKLKEQRYPETVIARVLADLTETGIADDTRFAVNWVFRRIKGKGKNLLAKELRFKGVEEETIQDSLDFLSEEDEAGAIQKLAEKLRRQGKDDRHIMQSLLRKRYPYALIREVLSEQKDDFNV